jgi:hypothetical protein
MVKHNRVPVVSLLALALVFAYLVVVATLNPSSIGREFLYPHEAFLAALSGAAVISTTFVAAYRAHHAGSWAWLLGSFVIWPLAFVYTLLINKGDEP